ncbi:MAG: hypothetical protein WD249_08815 [Gaiellaceae bacterium]
MPRRSIIRLPAPGTIADAAFATPAASAATSEDAGLPRYQPCGRVSSHCRASVVLPKPAGATSMIVRAFVSSSSRVIRGRSMMWLRARGGG